MTSGGRWDGDRDDLNKMPATVSAVKRDLGPTRKTTRTLPPFTPTNAERKLDADILGMKPAEGNGGLIVSSTIAL
jgi:hypothetical protein